MEAPRFQPQPPAVAAPTRAGLRPSEDRLLGALAVVAMLGLMWLVELVNHDEHGRLDQYGIRPRSEAGLEGLVTGPFLHASYAHLIGNTTPFLVLGLLIAWNGYRRVLFVAALVGLLSGFGVWLLAPGNEDVFGASGVVFGFAAYLIARGFFTHSPAQLLVAVCVLAVFGTTLAFSLLPHPNVSWQGHLYGVLAGVLAARLIDGRPAPTRAPGPSLPPPEPPPA